jgi:hypothetical protein
MLQLQNNSPFAAALALFPNEQGIDTLYTIVKATFSVYPHLTLAQQQIEPQQKDVYLGEPLDSSLVLASDYHTGKSATDILMTGSAFSLDGQDVNQLDVSLGLADLRKTVRVFGNRYWERGRHTAPDFFTEMPMVYEAAFGGVLLVDGQIHQLEERNPVGQGFYGNLTSDEVEGWPLPHLENPRQLISSLGFRPEPACFAPLAPHWKPRATFAGTYDQHWQSHRAPYLPEDYHPRFMNSAPVDQIYPEFLQGGEPVSIVGMHPMGELNFNLPAVNLVNRVHLTGQEVTTQFVLETVHLQPNALQVAMVWRSAYRCDKNAHRIRQISVHMAR